MLNSDYPRPDFDRSRRWSSLDGLWDFRADDEDWGAQMRVPGVWEDPTQPRRRNWLEVGWYRREVTVPDDWDADDVVFHFAAAFYTTDVWVDGVHRGRHVGGYTPFEVAVPGAEISRPATLVVRITAPIDKLLIPHGKQRSIPADDYDGCCFTPSSGLWSSVWIEPRNRTWIAAVRVTPRASLDGFDVEVRAGGERPAGRSVTVRLAETTNTAVTGPDGIARVGVDVPGAHLWTPRTPYLYTVGAVLEDGLDEVGTRAGMRRFETGRDGFYLNGERVYLRGVLDQGYWPNSGITPPSPDALRSDLELARRLGFNLVRKHIKPEDRRWYHYADELGVLVWAEAPNPGHFSPEAAALFEQELRELVARDYNHPSIVLWSAYNEEWGLDWDVTADEQRVAALRRAVGELRALDGTRPIVDNSGWAHVDTDVVDWHYYDQDPSSFRDTLPGILGPKGQLVTWHSPRHRVEKPLEVCGFERADQPLLNSEYGGGWNSLDRAWHSRWQTLFMRREQDNHGYVYTELFDIENEIVGVHDAWRNPKDTGGFDYSTVHAETVIIPGLSPVAPGIDLVIGDATELRLPVEISHVGPSELTGLRLLTRLGRPGAPGREQQLGGLTIRPYSLTAPIWTSTPVPAGPASFRVHFDLRTADGAPVATTFIDVRRRPPRSNFPDPAS
ncbi:glycoside hydrolase family 2 protein [Dactylosporangium sp. CA-092794]|uniref:glycoside hydrolase family 2 protein n=1 Tax=Dactylosporangium sp. CA-092794 TaxID=3239929 RepID=UPI003D8C114F